MLGDLHDAHASPPDQALDPVPRELLADGQADAHLGVFLAKETRNSQSERPPNRNLVASLSSERPTKAQDEVFRRSGEPVGRPARIRISGAGPAG
jgi:hypothetical protein